MCRLAVKTKTLKALHFQEVRAFESQVLSTWGQTDVNLHRLTLTKSSGRQVVADTMSAMSAPGSVTPGRALCAPPSCCSRNQSASWVSKLRRGVVAQAGNAPSLLKPSLESGRGLHGALSSGSSVEPGYFQPPLTACTVLPGGGDGFKYGRGG